MESKFICEICNVVLLRDPSKFHIFTQKHKNREEKINALNQIKSDVSIEHKMPLKNKTGEIIGTTILDKKVCIILLENNYAIWQTSGGYISVLINKKPQYLHRFVYYSVYENEGDDLKIQVDHINNNKLDNRIQNLRLVTPSENNRNKTKKLTKSSNYHGVMKRGNKWVCNVRHHGKVETCYYNEEIHAAYHYDLLIKEHKLDDFNKINNIKKPEDFVLCVHRTKNGLPEGINKATSGICYYYSLRGKAHHGNFTTVEEAVNARNKNIDLFNLAQQNDKFDNLIKRNIGGIAVIELFNAKKQKIAETTVDDEIYPTLLQYHWSLNTMGYVGCRINGKSWLIHRFIMSYYGKNIVDHINSDRLDNRALNLRIVTSIGNAQNRSSHKNSSSKYVGVSWIKSVKKWEASITVFGTKKRIGRFDSEIKAAYERDNYIIELKKTRDDVYFKLNF